MLLPIQRWPKSVALLLLFLSYFALLGPINAHGGVEVSLTWDPCPDPAVTGYLVYYGTESGVYPYVNNAGNSTNVIVPGLSGVTTYFFAVTAHDSTGLESDLSDEVSVTTPEMPDGPPPLPVLV